MLVKQNLFDKVMEILCISCLLAVTIYLIVQWNTIPDTIPGHYNASGMIDKMTDKSSLIGLQVITWILYILLTVVNHFPKIWNTGVLITEENKVMVYSSLKHMLVMLKLSVSIIFSYLTLYSLVGENLPFLFLPVSMFGVFGIMGFWLIKIVITNKKLKNK